MYSLAGLPSVLIAAGVSFEFSEMTWESHLRAEAAARSRQRDSKGPAESDGGLEGAGSSSASGGERSTSAPPIAVYWKGAAAARSTRAVAGSLFSRANLGHGSDSRCPGNLAVIARAAADAEAVTNPRKMGLLCRQEQSRILCGLSSQQLVSFSMRQLAVIEKDREQAKTMEARCCAEKSAHPTSVATTGDGEEVRE